MPEKPGAGEHERALVGLRRVQARDRPHRHEERVLVVVALVRRAPAVEAHPLRRVPAGGGLVHVIPDAREARLHVGRVELAPPGARLLGDEVGERGVAGPDLADVDVAALGAAEHVALDRLVEDPVARLVLDAGIDDRDDLEAVLAEPREHGRRVGEGLLVPREDAVAVHVLDVEPERVARHAELAMARAERLDRLLRVAEPAALVVAERPQRREARAAGEPRVGLEDVRHPRAGEHVLAVLAAVEPDRVPLGIAEVVLGPVAVVDERGRHLAGRLAVVVEERDRHVVRVELDVIRVRARVVRRAPRDELRGRVVVEHVGVPERVVAALAIVRAALLAQAVERVLGAAAAADRERVVQRRVRDDRLDHGRAVGAVDVEAERVAREGERQPARADADGVRVLLDREVDGVLQRVDAHRERRPVLERAATADPDPHDVLAHDVDLQPFAVQPRLDPPLGLLHHVHAHERQQSPDLGHLRHPCRNAEHLSVRRHSAAANPPGGARRPDLASPSMRLPTRVLPILLAACAVLLPSGTAHAEQFLGITPDDRLVHFTAMDHTLRAPVKLTGLAGIGRVVAVDVRPATGGLYGIAQSGSIIRLVRIDQASGAVTPIGAPADILSTPIGLGLDFNPTTDQISFVSDNQRSLGFLPDTGAPIFKSAPSPIAWFDDVAWTPASGGYAAPFALDSGLDRLVLGDGAGSYVPDPSYLGVQIGGHATIDFSSGGTLWLLVHNALYTVDTSTGVAAGVGAMADPVDSMAVQLTGEAGFGAAAFGATESDGSATVTLRRAAPADSVAKVKWSTGGGTATAGVDYTAASGEVTFAQRPERGDGHDPARERRRRRGAGADRPAPAARRRRSRRAGRRGRDRRRRRRAGGRRRRRHHRARAARAAGQARREAHGATPVRRLGGRLRHRHAAARRQGREEAASPGDARDRSAPGEPRRQRGGAAALQEGRAQAPCSPRHEGVGRYRRDRRGREPRHANDEGDADVKIVPPGGGEVIGDSAERRVEILCDRDEMHVTWSRFAAGRDGADLHVHHEHTDVFFVLAGELTVRLGLDGEERTLPTGGLALVPPDVVHGFRNGSGAEMRYLNVHAPGSGFADYMRGLRDGIRFVYDQHDPPEDGGRPIAEASLGVPPEKAGPVAIDLVEAADDDPAAPATRDHLLGAYVLDGELTVTTADGSRAAPAGTWIEVPAGEPVALSGGARLLRLQA